jgi:hypothetical protein
MTEASGNCVIRLAAPPRWAHSQAASAQRAACRSTDRLGHRSPKHRDREAPKHQLPRVLNLRWMRSSLSPSLILLWRASAWTGATP